MKRETLLPLVAFILIGSLLPGCAHAKQTLPWGRTIDAVVSTDCLAANSLAVSIDGVYPT